MIGIIVMTSCKLDRKSSRKWVIYSKNKCVIDTTYLKVVTEYAYTDIKLFNEKLFTSYLS